MSKHHILLILTGGTICSFADERGERGADTGRAKSLIVENFEKSDSPCVGAVTFDAVSPLNILSENMTVAHWNTLIGALKTYDCSAYDGVIILHGTDTLAYTASLLSLLLAGIKIPVFMVSSQLPIYMEEANGNANFRCAVELILGGITPNVYAVYRNIEKVGGEVCHKMYLHYGAHLLQCPNHSDNFYSMDMTEINEHTPVFEGKDCCAEEMPLYTCGELSPCVLRITPYVGINYDRYALDGVKAVLHGVYHSCTVSVNPYGEENEHKATSDSVLSLKRRCDACIPPVPLFIEPCNKDAYAYETTGIVLRSGARSIWGMTSEMAYVKLLLGCALGFEGDELQDYLHTEVNGEMIY